MPIEASFEDGYDTEPVDDEDVDVKSDPSLPTHEEAMTAAFDEFVTKTRSVLPLPGGCDIYIGLWADQETIHIPQAFFDFIAETKIPVIFDLND